ncbi:MAG: hypothetical protein U0525_04345 [Patescibacteria group bacterium]
MNNSKISTSLLETQPGLILTILFVVLTVVWFGGFGLHIWSPDIFAHVYFVVPLFGSVMGFIASKLWGGHKSALGSSILAFSIGLFLQFFGQVYYSAYYILVHDTTPYPSIGDIGYFGSIFFYIFAVYKLAQASGSRYSLKDLSYKIIALFLPFVLLAISYFLFIDGNPLDTSNTIKLILDLGYPLGQSFYISLALLALILSAKYLGGKLKTSVLIILLGLVLQYVADFTFLYQSSRGIWAPGEINDFVYHSAYFVLSLGVISFYKTYREISGK